VVRWVLGGEGTLYQWTRAGSGEKKEDFGGGIYIALGTNVYTCGNVPTKKRVARVGSAPLVARGEAVHTLAR
jgi:hypothetical protein